MTASASRLSVEQTRRFARQIALPEIGVEGQAHLASAAIALIGPPGSSDPTADVAAEYLRAAGVGRVDHLPPPAEGGLAWLATLAGRQGVVRFGFEDDALLRAAVRLGIPAVFGRASADQIDVVSLRRHGPCPHLALDLPIRPAGEPGKASGAAGPIAAALVATELLWTLLAPTSGPRARLLRLSLGGDGPPRSPQASEIPWAPECFICGGRSQEAAFDGGRP